MRKKIFLSLVLLLITQNIFGQSGWYRLSQPITSKNLSWVGFINEVGFIIGDSGTIIKSITLGETWNDISINADYNFCSASFLNKDSGYVLSKNSKILKTINGGITWELLPFSSAENFKSIYFKNVNNGLIISDGECFKTIDGGFTWESVKSYYGGKSLQFIDSLNGYILISYSLPPAYVWTTVVSKTTNFGINWITSSIFTHFDPQSIRFSSLNTGYITSNSIFGSGIMKTTNGGFNWTKIFQIGGPAATTLGDSIVFTSGYKSTNSGINWFSQNLGINPSLINGSFFINSTTGFLVGNNGVILKTTDGGGVLNQINLNSEKTPDNFSLEQNYPNPFNPSTVIRYRLSAAGIVSLKVFDLLGKEVASLVNEKQSAGSYAVDFNSAEYNIPSGIYFYTLNTGDFKETKKMVLIK
jgi:photosystem II stability/assembly factor-like uncharacterized protein